MILKEMERLPQIHVVADFKSEKDKVATAYPCQSAAEHFVWKGAQQGTDRK